MYHATDKHNAPPNHFKTDTGQTSPVLGLNSIVNANQGSNRWHLWIVQSLDSTRPGSHPARHFTLGANDQPNKLPS